MTVYVTGDKHGELKTVRQLAELEGLTADDTIVILGDAGFNYFGDERDAWAKHVVADIAPNILCIHGNHEMRPQSLPHLYHEVQWHGGMAFVEDEYPGILFAKDGEIYDLDGVSAIATGGAYSVDKWYRLENGLRWFPDEQPNDEIKADVEAKLCTLGKH